MDVVVVGGGPWSPDTNFPTHHTARLLAREHRVLYLFRNSHVSLVGRAAGRLPGFHSWSDLTESVFSGARVEQVGDRLWVSPLTGAAAAFPLSYPPSIRRLSASLVVRQLRSTLSLLRFSNPLLWFYWWFFPEIVRAVPHSLAVYDIYDDHSEYDYVRASPRRKQFTLDIERRLLHEVDLAFAVSQKLVGAKASYAPVRYLPNGVDIDTARRARAAGVPPDLEELPRPVIGYLGSFDARIDWRLVDELVAMRPGWSFVFVGGGDTAPIRTHPNLYLLGNRPYASALSYVNGFDVALIPFVLDALTEAVCPAKLFDYLALGKPIVATPFPAVSEIVGDSGMVYRGRTAHEFSALAERALAEHPSLAQQREEIAASFTWQRRTERAMSWIEEVLSTRGAVA
jgi:glycosyltransferase involved in cell wall biosynthesis